MEEHEKTLLGLAVIGAVIALGQMLSGTEPITARLFIGRVILGSATSMAAGAALVWLPGLSPVAIVGLGSALGIAGYQCVELWLKKKGSSLLTGKTKNDIKR